MTTRGRNTDDSAQETVQVDPAVVAAPAANTTSPAVAEANAGHDPTHLERVREEYSQFVALTAISIDGVRAFNEGDPVPASHPMREGWVKDDLVGPAPQG